MQNETQLLQIMTIFTGVAAVALVIQMAALVGVWFSIKKARERVSEFLDRCEPLADTAQKTLDDVRRESNEILKQVREITTLAKTQVEKADQTLEEISKTNPTAGATSGPDDPGAAGARARVSRGLAASRTGADQADSSGWNGHRGHD